MASPELEIAAAQDRDTAAILALNTASEALTSPMDQQRFELLASQSSQLLVVRRAGESHAQAVAFLMGFLAGTAYDSANYRWFDDRLKAYFYIDRVVVSETCRGAGVGRALYEWIEGWARSAGCRWLAAEINIEPPNPGSMEFHRRLGFVPVGRKVLAGGKILSMQLRGL